VIRLRRAGREHAIIEAIRTLDTRGNYRMHTRGEICRKMGIKSTSRIRDILNQMEANGQLVGATTALDGYAHEIAIYGIPVYYQCHLPDHEIVINGDTCRMSDMGQVVRHA
jgi:hypothetical protein